MRITPENSFRGTEENGEKLRWRWQAPGAKIKSGCTTANSSKRDVQTHHVVHWPLSELYLLYTTFRELPLLPTAWLVVITPTIYVVSDNGLHRTLNLPNTRLVS
jgi:hypothetical protein